MSPQETRPQPSWKTARWYARNVLLSFWSEPESSSCHNPTLAGLWSKESWHYDVQFGSNNTGNGMMIIKRITWRFDKHVSLLLLRRNWPKIVLRAVVITSKHDWVVECRRTRPQFSIKPSIWLLQSVVDTRVNCRIRFLFHGFGSFFPSLYRHTSNICSYKYNRKVTIMYGIKRQSTKKFNIMMTEMCVFV